MEKSQDEKKTAFVVLFSAVIMVLEIFFGLFSNSMALLADGIHMGSHVLAIGLSWGAYVLVRHLKRKQADNIDSEKVLTLAAYTSGVLLLLFAIFIIVEAVERFFVPNLEIRYLEAMVVAAIGLIVNIICALVICAMIWNITWIDTIVALICSAVIIRWATRMLFDTSKNFDHQREKNEIIADTSRQRSEGSISGVKISQ